MMATLPSDSNMAIWSQVEMTDPSKTKPFNRQGGFRGTATNATFLAMRATELFGPWGTGWGWTVLDERYVEGHAFDERNRAVVHVLKIRFWYVHNGQRGESEHYGQTMFVGKTSSGLFTDEEAPKKSLTDAMSKALSMLGFAADIHMGLFDDNKYVNDAREKFAAETRPDKAIATPATEKISPAMAYVANARNKMQTFSKADELRTWWRTEEKARTAAGITKGSRDYETLYTDFCAIGHGFIHRAA
jgi:hypothetical protein